MRLPTNPLRTDRRSFIKHFALSTAVSMWAGKPWTARLLADVDPYGQPVGRIVIKVSDYPSLQYQFGSVVFTFAGQDGGYFPFSLNRADDENVFYAVDTRCTHMGCPVDGFVAQRSAMVCQCHFSQYDIMGRVIQGPAMNDLERYRLTYDGLDTITVFIPGIDMSIRDIAVQEQAGSTVRLRLQFPTIPYGRYKVQYRQNLSDEPLDVYFADTPTGAASLDFIEAPNGLGLTVYVDASLPRGFFSVALIVDGYEPRP